jgi:hypothetical protein
MVDIQTYEHKGLSLSVRSDEIYFDVTNQEGTVIGSIVRPRWQEKNWKAYNRFNGKELAAIGPRSALSALYKSFN